MSPAIGVGQNYRIRGTLEYNAGQRKWYIRAEDVTTRQPTSIYSGAGYVPDSDVNIQTVFEGFMINSADDVPGDTTFTNMVYRNENGDSIPITYRPYYDFRSAITPLGLSVDLSSSPRTVFLNTAN